MTPKEQVEMYGYALKAMPPIQKNGKPGAIKDTFFYVENKDGVLHYAVKMESTVHTGVINASDINDVNGIKFSSLLNEGLDFQTLEQFFPALLTLTATREHTTPSLAISPLNGALVAFENQLNKLIQSSPGSTLLIKILSYTNKFKKHILHKFDMKKKPNILGLGLSVYEHFHITSLDDINITNLYAGQSKNLFFFYEAMRVLNNEDNRNSIMKHDGIDLQITALLKKLATSKFIDEFNSLPGTETLKTLSDELRTTLKSGLPYYEMEFRFVRDHWFKQTTPFSKLPIESLQLELCLAELLSSLPAKIEDAAPFINLNDTWMNKVFPEAYTTNRTQALEFFTLLLAEEPTPNIDEETREYYRQVKERVLNTEVPLMLKRNREFYEGLEHASLRMLAVGELESDIKKVTTLNLADITDDEFNTIYTNNKVLETKCHELMEALEGSKPGHIRDGLPPPALDLYKKITFAIQQTQECYEKIIKINQPFHARHLEIKQTPNNTDANESHAAELPLNEEIAEDNAHASITPSELAYTDEKKALARLQTQKQQFDQEYKNILAEFAIIDEKIVDINTELESIAAQNRENYALILNESSQLLSIQQTSNPITEASAVLAHVAEIRKKLTENKKQWLNDLLKQNTFKNMLDEVNQQAKDKKIPIELLADLIDKNSNIFPDLHGNKYEKLEKLLNAEPKKGFFGGKSDSYIVKHLKAQNIDKDTIKRDFETITKTLEEKSNPNKLLSTKQNILEASEREEKLYTLEQSILKEVELAESHKRNIEAQKQVEIKEKMALEAITTAYNNYVLMLQHIIQQEGNTFEKILPFSFLLNEFAQCIVKLLNRIQAFERTLKDLMPEDIYAIGIQNALNSGIQALENKHLALDAIHRETIEKDIAQLHEELNELNQIPTPPVNRDFSSWLVGIVQNLNEHKANQETFAANAKVNIDELTQQFNEVSEKIVTAAIDKLHTMLRAFTEETSEDDLSMLQQQVTNIKAANLFESILTPELSVRLTAQLDNIKQQTSEKIIQKRQNDLNNVLQRPLADYPRNKTNSLFKTSKKREEKINSLIDTITKYVNKTDGVTATELINELNEAITIDPGSPFSAALNSVIVEVIQYEQSRKNTPVTDERIGNAVETYKAPNMAKLKLLLFANIDNLTDLSSSIWHNVALSNQERQCITEMSTSLREKLNDLCDEHSRKKLNDSDFNLYQQFFIAKIHTLDPLLQKSSRPEMAMKIACNLILSVLTLGLALIAKAIYQKGYKKEPFTFFNSETKIQREANQVEQNVSSFITHLKTPPPEEEGPNNKGAR